MSSSTRFSESSRTRRSHGSDRSDLLSRCGRFTLKDLSLAVVIVLGLGIALFLSFSGEKTKAPPVRFAIIADTHAQDIPDGKERLSAFLEDAKAQHVDFIIQLGDFIRPDEESGLALKELWDSFSLRTHHALGNHDLDKCTFESYLTSLNIPHRYYSFDQGDFHFIILDPNNLYDGTSYTHYAKGNYYAHPKRCSFIDDEQLTWLKNDLASTDRRCLVFSHQSLDHAVANRDDIRALLEGENIRAGYPKVIAAFAGHDHSNYSRMINNIAYVQINSASYVWIGSPTQAEKRYPEDVRKKYSLLGSIIPYDKPLYAVVTLTPETLTIKGQKGNFVSPTPRDLGLPDTRGSLPLSSEIQDLILPLPPSSKKEK